MDRMDALRHRLAVDRLTKTVGLEAGARDSRQLYALRRRRWTFTGW